MTVGALGSGEALFDIGSGSSRSAKEDKLGPNAFEASFHEIIDRVLRSRCPPMLLTSEIQSGPIRASPLKESKGPPKGPESL